MKILMLNNEFPPLGGGTASINQQLLKNLDDLEIDLVTSALRNAYEENKISKKHVIYKVPVNNKNIHHSSNLELIKYFFLGLLKALKLNRKQNYSLCMAWCTVPAGAMALILKIFTGLPYVVRVSGPDIPGFESRYNYLYPILKPILKLVWSNAEMVISKCEHENNLINKTKKLNNLKVIPNATDSNLFKPTTKNYESETFKLLCVARLIQRKGQDRIISALEKTNKKVQLHLVGTGDEEENYKKLVKKLNLEERVFFHGYVERKEILKIYNSAHAFILLSDNEGMTAAGLEAMACGLPLLLSKDCGMNNLNNTKNGFLIDINNKEEIIEKINFISSNLEEVKKMAEESRNFAQNFTWTEVSNKYRKLFKENARFKETII